APDSTHTRASLFRSTDNGNTWRQITGGGESVRCVRVSDAGDVITGNNNGLDPISFCYRSTDNGDSWRPLGDSLAGLLGEDLSSTYSPLSVSRTGAAFVQVWSSNGSLFRLGPEH